MRILRKAHGATLVDCRGGFLDFPWEDLDCQCKGAIRLAAVTEESAMSSAPTDQLRCGGSGHVLSPILHVDGEVHVFEIPPDTACPMLLMVLLYRISCIDVLPLVHYKVRRHLSYFGRRFVVPESLTACAPSTTLPFLVQSKLSIRQTYL